MKRLRALLPTQIISMGGGISLVLATLIDVALFMGLYMMLSLSRIPSNGSGGDVRISPKWRRQTLPG